MPKKILFSASIFHGLNDAATVTVPMIFPLLYSQQFIITKYAHIGILSNLGLLMTLFCQLIIAHFSHKYEYRHMLLFSLGGISLSLILITFSWSFVSLLLFYLLMRIFTSFYHSVGVATVSISHPDKAMDFAMGVQSASGNIGLFLAFVMTGFVAQSLGWPTPLVGLAFILFLFGGISYVIVKKTSTVNPSTHPPEFRSWKRALHETAGLFPGFFFGGACWGTTVFYAPSLFHHKFQVSLGNTGLYLALWIAIGTVMPYLLGYLSRKVGRSNIIWLSFLGTTLFLGLLGLSPLKELAVVSLVLFGAFLFMIYPALQSVVGSKASDGLQTQAFSIVANVQMLAGAIVSLIAGFLSDALGISSPFIFVSILGILTTTYFIHKIRSF
jgi:FSR family fosmidomycin resistance protein-like MFS transporter